jgi:hypothetical protein
LLIRRFCRCLSLLSLPLAARLRDPVIIVIVIVIITRRTLAGWLRTLGSVL